MILNIHQKTNGAPTAASIVLVEKNNLPEVIKEAPAHVLSIAKSILNDKQSSIHVPTEQGHFWVVALEQADDNIKIEDSRRIADTIQQQVVAQQIKEAGVLSYAGSAAHNYAFCEGLCLGSYRFNKYFTKTPKQHITDIHICDSVMPTAKLEELKAIVSSNFIARDFVNEPLSYLTAEQYSEDMEALGKQFGFDVEVFHKAKIESLKMGGLLAVNLGSETPPTFNILEWKPADAKNSQPIVLVGKGVVFDTGGLSLKPTPNSMDEMKCDMAGSAAVVGIFCALAQMKLPVHVIGLIPATDNRPGKNAYVPGDVIKMYNGMTVEVLNTDAEGRMIMADALAWAQQYKPALVMDYATLTGSAFRAVGTGANVVMGTASEEVKAQFHAAGHDVYERLVELPMWREYGDQIKSTIADIKNVGGANAGAITAGKFLEHFTDYPWLHFDLSSAFLHSRDSYRGDNATAAGVRLTIDFFKKHFDL